MNTLQKKSSCHGIFGRRTGTYPLAQLYQIGQDTSPGSILIQRVVLHILAMAYLVGESIYMLYQTREVKAQILGDKLDT